jgi:hypothetical protein
MSNLGKSKLQREREILERKEIKELAFPLLASEGKGKKKVRGEKVEGEGMVFGQHLRF